jgi:putrescine:ornithine antiporter
MIQILTLLAVPLLLAQQPVQPPQRALQRLRATNHISVGYRVDARPFAYKDEGGRAAGYSVELCQTILEAIKQDASIPAPVVDWVPVKATDRFEALLDGKIDLLCGATTITLTRRMHMSFSIPVFGGGVGAVIRKDAPAALQDVLGGRVATANPAWQAAAAQALQSKGFAAMEGTTAFTWLHARMGDLHVLADVVPVKTYEAGVQAVVDQKVDAFFGERATLLDAARRQSFSTDLAIVDRLFTYEPIGLGVRRGDDELRMIVDRTLSRLYTSGGIVPIYARWFGTPGEAVLTFFRMNALPE